MKTHIATSLFTLALLAVGSGCASTRESASYRSTTVAFDAAPHTVKKVVQLVIDARNWEIVREDDNLIEAVSEVETLLSDLPVRDRWLFSIRGGEVEIQRIFEAQFPGTNQWASSVAVCNTYQYLRENQVADAVNALLADMTRREAIASLQW